MGAVLDAADEVEEAARVGHRLTEVAQLEDRVGGHQTARGGGHHQRAVRQLQGYLGDRRRVEILSVAATEKSRNEIR